MSHTRHASMVHTGTHTNTRMCKNYTQNVAKKRDAQYPPGTHIMPHTPLPWIPSSFHYKCLLKQPLCIKRKQFCVLVYCY